MLNWKRGMGAVILSILVAGTGSSMAAPAVEEITIGFNLPLSGSRNASGQNTKNGAELLLEEVNAQGGVMIGDKRYPLRFIYIDNGTNLEKAVSGTLELITNKKVLGIIGPNSSSRAIPVGGIAQSFKVPMVSPTSTNPKTTEARPFVFRACFLDDFQGEVMARFAGSEFAAKKAAVLFDKESVYPTGLAASFKASFEKEHGAASVVAYESFEKNPSDLGAQLKQIVNSGAEVLFIPQYSNEVPTIMQQVRKAGWTKPVIGGDAWASSDLLEQCGDTCKGSFFSAHFAPQGAQGKAKAFVDAYQSKYQALPADHAALGYDAASLLVSAISKLDHIDSNLFAAREAVMRQLSTLQGFQGVSGLFDMNSSGNPAKSAVVIRISDNGQFESYASVSPGKG